MYELPELPYEYDALEPQLSSELLELHHSAHHAAYVKGANPQLDTALARRPAVDAFLRQAPDAVCTLPESLDALEQLAAEGAA